MAGGAGFHGARRAVHGRGRSIDGTSAGSVRQGSGAVPGNVTKSQAAHRGAPQPSAAHQGGRHDVVHQDDVSRGSLHAFLEHVRGVFDVIFPKDGDYPCNAGAYTVSGGTPLGAGGAGYVLSAVCSATNNRQVALKVIPLSWVEKHSKDLVHVVIRRVLWYTEEARSAVAAAAAAAAAGAPEHGAAHGADVNGVDSTAAVVSDVTATSRGPSGGGQLSEKQSGERGAVGTQDAGGGASNGHAGRVVDVHELTDKLASAETLAHRALRRRRVIDEIAVHAQLSRYHGVVTLHAGFVAEQDIILVMDHVDQGSLQDFLTRQELLVGSRFAYQRVASLDWISTLIFKLAITLRHLHAGNIVHRDIKPANILLDKGYSMPLLCDFGLAGRVIADDGTDGAHMDDTGSAAQVDGGSGVRGDGVVGSVGGGGDVFQLVDGDERGRVMQRARGTLTSFVGTPLVMAPEVMVTNGYGKEDGENVSCIGYGKPADVWALGCNLYRLLYGKFPFEGRDVATTMRIVARAHLVFPSTQGFDGALVPDTAVDLLRKMLCRDPKHRATVDDVLKHDYFRSDKFRGRRRVLEKFGLVEPGDAVVASGEGETAGIATNGGGHDSDRRADANSNSNNSNDNANDNHELDGEGSGQGGNRGERRQQQRRQRHRHRRRREAGRKRKGESRAVGDGSSDDGYSGSEDDVSSDSAGVLETYTGELPASAKRTLAAVAETEDAKKRGVQRPGDHNHEVERVGHDVHAPKVGQERDNDDRNSSQCGERNVAIERSGDMLQAGTLPDNIFDPASPPSGQAAARGDDAPAREQGGKEARDGTSSDVDKASEADQGSRAEHRHDGGRDSDTADHDGIPVVPEEHDDGTYSDAIGVGEQHHKGEMDGRKSASLGEVGNAHVQDHDHDGGDVDAIRHDMHHHGQYDRVHHSLEGADRSPQVCAARGPDGDNSTSSYPATNGLVGMSSPPLIVRENGPVGVAQGGGHDAGLQGRSNAGRGRSLSRSVDTDPSQGAMAGMKYRGGGGPAGRGGGAPYGQFMGSAAVEHGQIRGAQGGAFVPHELPDVFHDGSDGSSSVYSTTRGSQCDRGGSVARSRSSSLSSAMQGARENGTTPDGTVGFEAVAHGPNGVAANGVRDARGGARRYGVDGGGSGEAWEYDSARVPNHAAYRGGGPSDGGGPSGGHHGPENGGHDGRHAGGGRYPVLPPQLHAARQGMSLAHDYVDSGHGGWVQYPAPNMRVSDASPMHQRSPPRYGRGPHGGGGAGRWAGRSAAPNGHMGPHGDDVGLYPQQQQQQQQQHEQDHQYHQPQHQQLLQFQQPQQYQQQYLHHNHHRPVSARSPSVRSRSRSSNRSASRQARRGGTLLFDMDLCTLKDMGLYKKLQAHFRDPRPADGCIPVVHEESGLMVPVFPVGVCPGMCSQVFVVGNSTFAVQPHEVAAESQGRYAVLNMRERLLRTRRCTVQEPGIFSIVSVSSGDKRAFFKQAVVSDLMAGVELGTPWCAPEQHVGDGASEEEERGDVGAGHGAEENDDNDNNSKRKGG